MKQAIYLMAILFVSFSLHAQTKEDLNFKGEKKRIHQGIASGEITRAEARHIRKEMRAVQYAKRNALRDGHITPKERVRIAKQDKQLDRAIYRSKHNNRRR